MDGNMDYEFFCLSFVYAIAYGPRSERYIAWKDLYQNEDNT